MTIRRTMIGATTLLAFVAAPVTPALAQTSTDPAPGAETPAAPQVPNIEVSEAELESFVDAVIEISDVRDDYVSRIQAADTDEDRQALQAEAREKMTAAVEAVDGMDTQRFNEIGAAARQNEELNARILEMAQARQGEMQGGAQSETEDG